MRRREAAATAPSVSRSLSGFLGLTGQDQIERPACLGKYLRRSFQLRGIAANLDLTYRSVQLMQWVSEVGTVGRVGEVGERVSQSRAPLLQAGTSLGRDG